MPAYIATEAFDGPLYQLARKFFDERGVTMPLAGTPSGDVAYRLWKKWGYADVDGKHPERKASALREIEDWIREELGK